MSKDCNSSKELANGEVPSEKKGYSFSSVDSEGMNFKLPSALDDRSTLQELWETGALCDVVLHSKDGLSIKAHKLVLCSMSAFFRAAFIGAGAEMGQDIIENSNGQQSMHLRGISGEQLTILLNALYKKELRITPNNLGDVLSFSNLLGMHTIKDACCQFLRWTLGLHSCLQILMFADMYDCAELEEEVLDYLCSKFSELKCLKIWNIYVPRLSKKSIFQILQRDDLACDSEKEIFEFGIEWIKGSVSERKKYLNKIISLVQLQQEEVVSVLQNNGLDRLIPINSAAEEQVLDSMMDIEDCDSLFQKKPQRHRATEIYVVGGHDSSWRCLRGFEIYNPIVDEWRTGTSMPSSCSFTAAVSARGDIFVVGATKSMFQYNVIRDQWMLCPPMTVSRLHCGVASIGGTVYCCGGRTGIGSTLKTVEFYEVLKHSKEGLGKWVKGPAMNFPRCTHAACNLNSYVYVIGGQSSKKIYDSVEKLDAEKQEWITLSESMRHARKYLTVSSLNGRIYAIGGMNIQRMRLAEVETYDPREGKWKNTSALQKGRSSHASAVLNGKIYIFGGNGDDDNTHSIVECYIPEKNEWITSCAPMFCGRSGLSAVAI